MSIKADSINIDLGGRSILNDVSIKIHQGEILSVIGPNGAGKSTLLKSLAGDIKPSSGAIHYDNKDKIDFIEYKISNYTNYLYHNLLMI